MIVASINKKLISIQRSSTAFFDFSLDRKAQSHFVRKYCYNEELRVISEIQWRGRGRPDKPEKTGRTSSRVPRRA